MNTPRRRLNLREWFVYIISDATGQPLYVGMSCRPEARWRQHQINPAATWTDEAAKFKLIGPFHYQRVKDVERETIRSLQPLGNVLHTKRAGAMIREAARKRSLTCRARRMGAVTA